MYPFLGYPNVGYYPMSLGSHRPAQTGVPVRGSVKHIAGSRVILIGVAAMALLGAFPPWVLRAPYWSRGGTPLWPGVEHPVGLHFILTPPPEDGVLRPSVDYGRLLVTWSVVGLLTVAAALAVRRQPDRSGDTAHPQPPRPSGTVG